jgi:hypothetical protein
MPDRPMNSPEPLPVTAMTWAALLARWTEFARASVAFPKDETGDRWRASVAPVIGLQSVAFALGEVDALGAEERALGLDRASVLVRTHAGDLHSVWRGEAMPDALREVVDDAQRALTLARSRGVEYRVALDRLEAPDVLDALRRSIDSGARVDFALAPAPGTSLFRTEPALFVRPGIPGLVVDSLELVPSPPRQIYRQPGRMNEPARDVIALFDDAIQPGAPLLRVVIDEGRVVAPVCALAPSRVERAEVFVKPLDEDRE